MGAYEYLALLAACLLITLPLEFLPGVRVYRRPRRLLLALGCMGIVFVSWDLLGAHLGHWAYNERYVTGIRFLGLPLEEYLFFVAVPICAVLTYQAVSATLDQVSRWLRRMVRR